MLSYPEANDRGFYLGKTMSGSSSDVLVLIKLDRYLVCHEKLW